jgi:hypothetical protein
MLLSLNILLIKIGYYFTACKTSNRDYHFNSPLTDIYFHSMIVKN